jgi:putative hydrolase of the HAD superfamily
MEKVVLWDFDGTLAHRPGMWRGCLIETLDLHEPAHGVSAEALIPFLHDGFPWHTPDLPHPELSSPEAWWERVELLLARAYEGVGFNSQQARQLARLAHERYVDCNAGWRLFDDVLPVLNRLASRGWRHVILSNHVPELSALVTGLGLAPVVDHVFCSAVTGFEKPHPEAFALALAACGKPAACWMVGDNPVADVAGAEAAGIQAILVRTNSSVPTRRATDLYEVEHLIEHEQRFHEP